MNNSPTKLNRLGGMLVTLAQCLIYPSATTFRSGRSLFIILSLLHSASLITVFWLFAGPGVILYFICILLALILAIRNKNCAVPKIRYTKRIPVMLTPLVILVVGISTLALSIKDVQNKEFLTAQKSKGEKLAKLKCSICHSLKGRGIKVGPPLADIHMRKIGSFAGFNYSNAFKNSDEIWTEKELDAFLKDVQTYLKGSNMIIQNVDDESERKALIAYLIDDSKG